MPDPKEIILKISQPCSADWNSMSPTNQGKYCSTCSKQVFDMTHSSPEKIYEVYKSQKGDACMRINSDNLNKRFMIPAKPWYASLRSNYQKAALFIGIQLLAFSQIKAQVKALTGRDKNSDGQQRKYLKSITISGMVADSGCLEPIPFVKVQVRKENRIIGFTFSRTDGSYDLILNDSIFDNEPASIEFVRTNFGSVFIQAFCFNKPHIFFDTVLLNKSAYALTSQPDRRRR